MTNKEEIEMLRREVADLRARIAYLEANRFVQFPTQPVVFPTPVYPAPWPQPWWQPTITC